MSVLLTLIARYLRANDKTSSAANSASEIARDTRIRHNSPVVDVSATLFRRLLVSISDSTPQRRAMQTGNLRDSS